MEYEGNHPVRTLLPDRLEGYSLTGTGDFPRIAKEEIQDRSKGDIISKGIVVLQTGWFVMQCIARQTQGLPITELELVTIAYAVLNFIMYWMWWDKPLNVQRAVRVYKKYNPDETSADGPVTTNDAGFWLTLCLSLSTMQSAVAARMSSVRWPIVWPIVWPILQLGKIVNGSDRVAGGGDRVDTFYPRQSRYIVLLAVAMAFGAIHCIAWPFAFASDADRMLWRVTSVTITALPLTYPLGMFIWGAVYGPVFDDDTDSIDPWPTTIAFAFVFSQPYAYGLGRVVLLVLSFLSLRALPPDAYLSIDWTTLIPHVW
jgi:hypothetical protein